MLPSDQSTKGRSSATGRTIASTRCRDKAWIRPTTSVGKGGFACRSRLPSSLVGQSARGPTPADSIVGLRLRVFDFSKSIMESSIRPSSAGEPTRLPMFRSSFASHVSTAITAYRSLLFTIRSIFASQGEIVRMGRSTSSTPAHNRPLKVQTAAAGTRRPTSAANRQPTTSAKATSLSQPFT